MADLIRGDLNLPDEVLEFPNIKASLVELGDLKRYAIDLA